MDIFGKNAMIKPVILQSQNLKISFVMQNFTLRLSFSDKHVTARISDNISYSNAYAKPGLELESNMLTTKLYYLPFVNLRGSIIVD